ncbi:nucleotide exchange factor GrpE [Streptomyces sp. NPDC046909]|uniref:nucleotide exchange factor GrpE n=1 Tax=Streptomyces sp. NPDC046909 TaxID=3155617 RepID=UPI0033C95426
MTEHTDRQHPSQPTPTNTPETERPGRSWWRPRRRDDRATAEQATTAETESREAERTARAETETLRAAEQAARAEAESLRAAEQTARAEAESLQAAEQTARAEAESLRGELAALRHRLDHALAEIKSNQTELTLLERESARAAEEVAELRGRLDAQAESASRLRALQEAADRPPPVAAVLVRMADQLADLRASVEAGTLDAATLLRWLDRRLPELHAEVGIETVDDEGPLDLTRHEVLETRPGGDAPRILSTVRPGYRWRDHVLRPQQVIAETGDAEDPAT